MKAKIARRKNKALAQRTGVETEPLLNVLARTMGRAAGAIANAAQGLSGESKAPIVSSKGKKKRRKRPNLLTKARVTKARRRP